MWLLIAAYPLWSGNQLAGSPAEGMAKDFLRVTLPIVAMHLFRSQIYFGKETAFVNRTSLVVPQTDISRKVSGILTVSHCPRELEFSFACCRLFSNSVVISLIQALESAHTQTLTSIATGNGK